VDEKIIFMYRPQYTQTENDKQIAELLKGYPFVTLASVSTDGEPFFSHVPVVTRFDGDKLTAIQGHIALRNPHVKLFESNNRVTVIFHGPHTYVSPTFYISGRDVPTWNYCVVHVKGEIKLDHGFESICKNLVDLTKVFEGQKPDAWRFELPADLKKPEQLTSAIIAFEIIPKSIEAKFKLAQSRPRADQEGVITGLTQRGDEMSAEIARLMKKNLETV
jgi:transcriptional regulator